MEQYQDIWVKGSLYKAGVRECEDRYKIISDFCKNYKRPFTVLDIGANLGYFSLRLAEDFDCTCVAVDGGYGKWLSKILKENDNPNVLHLNKNMSLSDLRTLAACEHFDVVLALSVIHHFPNNYDETLEVFKSLGDHLIIELPNEQRACGARVVDQIQTAGIPAGGVVLGYGKSHLANSERPIVLIPTPKNRLTLAYIGCPRVGELKTITYVNSNYDEKTVSFSNKAETREWMKGINLQTFLHFNGAYPDKPSIAEAVEKASMEGTHSDLTKWNVIIQGKEVQFIDYADPNHMRVTVDNIARQSLIDSLKDSLDKP